MEKSWFVIAVIVVILALLGALNFNTIHGGLFGPSPSKDTPIYSPLSSSTQNITVFYFYGEGCLHCENVKPFLIELTSKYPNLDLIQLEVYHNTTNQNLFSRFQKDYNITTVGVPTIFVGNYALIGDTQIKDNIEKIILQIIQQTPNSTPLGIPPRNPLISGGGCPVTTPSLTLPLVVTCALIDSINPCAFAVLVFLLLSIITLESRRRVLAVGSAYILAVFFFYLLSGIGMFSFVLQFGFSQILFLAAAVIAILLGLVNVIDVFRKNEGFILAIPESKKDLIEKYIRNVSIPAAFILGILVGIFELPCTGGIYLAILGLMSKTLTISQGLPYLLLYNFIFVMPLIAILLIISFGLSPEQVNSWRLENRRMLRFIIGLVMIVIGALMLSGLL